MNQVALTYGNLALSLENTETVAPRPRFEVVNGGRASVHGSRPDVLASISHAKCPLPLAIAFSLGLAVVLLGSFLYCEISAQNVYESALASTSQVELSVQSGDTLWAIAEAHPISGLSTADTANVISEWNDLEGACLQAGELLLVPAAS